MAINRTFAGTNIRPPGYSGSMTCPKCGSTRAWKQMSWTARRDHWEGDKREGCWDCGYIVKEALRIEKKTEVRFPLMLTTRRS